MYCSKAFIAIALNLLLSACVPFVGDYSEFSVKAKPGVPKDAVAETAGFQPFLGGKYSGFLRGGYPHGKGTFIFDNGNRYEGNFVNGRMEGAGVMRYRNGRVVGGTISEGRVTEARLVYPDGSRFDGQVLAGVAVGAGTLRRADGTEQTGAFKSDKLEGKGLQVSPDGTSYWGNFSGGTPHGQGICNSGGMATVCHMQWGADDTQAEMERVVERRAQEIVAEEARRQSEALKKESDSIMAVTQKEVNTAEKNLVSASPPTKSDKRCWCSLWRLTSDYAIGDLSCIVINVSSGNEDAATRKHAELKRKLEDAKETAECSEKYSDWLGSRKSPGLQEKIAALRGQLESARQTMLAQQEDRARRQREIDVREQQRLADREEQARLRQQEERALQERRERQIRDTIQQCGDERFRRSHPCLCAAASPSSFPHKGTVCEA